jgi:hypothetical protein
MERSPRPALHGLRLKEEDSPIRFDLICSQSGMLLQSLSPMTAPAPAPPKFAKIRPLPTPQPSVLAGRAPTCHAHPQQLMLPSAPHHTTRHTLVSQRAPLTPLLTLIGQQQAVAAGAGRHKHWLQPITRPPQHPPRRPFTLDPRPSCHQLREPARLPAHMDTPLLSAHMQSPPIPLDKFEPAPPQKDLPHAVSSFPHIRTWGGSNVSATAFWRTATPGANSAPSYRCAATAHVMLHCLPACPRSRV